MQLLDEEGRAVTVISFIGNESPLACDGFEVPEAVFKAALRQSHGGDYVNARGQSVGPILRELREAE